MNTIELPLKNLPIELYKILKITGITSGGEGKMLISNGYVYVNGEQETQKRKKIYKGDTVTFDQYNIVIAEDTSLDEPELHETQNDNSSNKRKKNKVRGKPSLS